MTTSAFPKLQTEDRELNQLQSNVLNKLNYLFKNPLLSGEYQDVVLAVGDNTIQHSLGQKPTGYIVCLQDAASTIFDKQSTNNQATTNLILNASVATNVTLYIF
jgi:hypothetical protein